MKKFIFLILIFFGISCFLGSYSVYANTKKFLDDGIKTNARVIEITKNPEGKFAPILLYRTPSSEVETTLNIFQTKSIYEVGEVIDIVYNKVDPHDIKINSFRSLYFQFGLFILTGILFTSFGSWKFFTMKQSTQKTVRIFTTQNCAYCKRAKDFFSSLKISFIEIDLEKNKSFKEKLFETYSWRTVPMIFIGEEFVGGCDDVLQLHKEGKLLKILHEK
jgi:glutaredoxin 3